MPQHLGRAAGHFHVAKMGLEPVNRCGDDGLIISALWRMQAGSEGRRIAKDLMPDALHPNDAGQDRVLSCLDPHLAPYLPGRNATL